MTGKEFDRTIKDKTEQAHYPFKEAAWESFSRKSGVASGSRFTRNNKTLAVVSAAVITAGVVSGILIHTNKTRTQPQTPQETAAADSSSVNTDTLVLQMPLQEESVPSEDKNPAVSNTAHKETEAKKNNVVAEPISGDTLSNGRTEKAESKPVPKRGRATYGRPLEINVDTITDMEPTDEQLRRGNSRLF